MVRTHTKNGRWSALAGLEAGVIAALILLGWLALLGLVSAFHRTAANIMATTFYGEAALGREFTFRTVAGIALYLVALRDQAATPVSGITLIGVAGG